MKKSLPEMLPAVGFALFALTVSGGCGRKAPPLPPIIRVAERTRDLEAVQDESIVKLRWSFPQMTSAGGPLPDLEAVAVWRMVIPTAQEPQGSGLQDRKVRTGLLKARGEVIAEFAGDELDLATRGAFLVADDNLSLIAVGDDTVENVIWYAVRSRCCDNRWSDFSNIARVAPADPPAPPQGLKTTADRDGVQLGWSAEEGLAVRVERSQDGSVWEEIDTLPASATTWTDTTATQGVRWYYRLRSVDRTSDGDIARIGPPGPPVSVNHPDLYPPEPPEDLVCLPEGRRIRLRWRAAIGASAYEVQRHAGGEAAEFIAKSTPDVFFVDEAPPSGNVHYSVRSIDDAGNSSEPAGCETVVEEGP